MTDYEAAEKGYTVEYMMTAIGGEYEFPILIKPETDLDSRFKAWNMEEKEFIIVEGSVCYLRKMTLREYEERAGLLSI